MSQVTRGLSHACDSKLTAGRPTVACLVMVLRGDFARGPLFAGAKRVHTRHGRWGLLHTDTMSA
eukprot:5195058-Prymnesium_polylepis.1